MNKTNQLLEERYLEEKFEEWFDCPLTFDSEINDSIKRIAKTCFKKGYLLKPPTLLEKFILLFK